MHPMEPLERGLGLCHVRTQVVLDEPPGELPRLTESVLGYLAEVSGRTPVIYVACDGARRRRPAGATAGSCSARCAAAASFGAGCCGARPARSTTGSAGSACAAGRA